MNAGILSITVRSVFQQRSRAMFGLTAIVAGVVALVIAGGFIEWNLWALREGTIQSRLGHIQVMREGYRTAGAANPHAYLLPEGTAQLASIESMPHVEVATPRLSFAGLISHGETTVSFLGEGVVPDKEQAISRYLSFGEGKGLSSKERGGIILGKGLAATLGVGAGDPVVLLVSKPRGGIAAVDVVVRDTFYTSSKAFDDVALRVPIDLARQLAGVKGAHRWVVLLDDTENTDAALGELRARLGKESNSYEFVPWHAQADYYAKVKTLYSAQFNVLQLIIAVVITVSISNALVMSVMERTSEIGTMMALGSRRRTILGMFVAEGALVGLVGAFVGVVLGWLLALLISAIGIPMPPSPGMDFSYVGRIAVTVPAAVGAAAVALAAALAGSLYPAWKASRLPIVDALRHSK
jgi:putative ABC transport system permease protein